MLPGILDEDYTAACKADVDQIEVDRVAAPFDQLRRSKHRRRIVATKLDDQRPGNQCTLACSVAVCGNGAGRMAMTRVKATPISHRSVSQVVNICSRYFLSSANIRECSMGVYASVAPNL